MNPTGNLQGSYCFLSLATGKCIKRRKWTELPITDDVIARVHELARANKSFDPAPNFFFEWAPNTPVADLPAEHQEQPHLPVLGGVNNPDGNNTDEDEEAEENAEENAKENAEENAEEEKDEAIYEDEGAPGVPDEDEGAPGAPGKDEGAPGAPGRDEGAQGAQEAPPHNEEQVQNDEIEEQEAQEAVDEAPETVDEAPPVPPGHGHNLRGKKLNYDKRLIAICLTQLGDIVPKGARTDTAVDLQNHISVVGVVFNQMGAKAGVKQYGEEAIQTIVAECKQLDDKKAFKPCNRKDLTTLERKKALRAITLVKEKRCGRIKGRTVADSREQRDHIERVDATSPTVSIEALMISIAIDAKEKRVVATADVEVAYLHADIDEVVIIVYEGDMVDYMVQDNPKKYGPCVHTAKNGKRLLYVELLKALYGCIKSALVLWYKLCTSTLQEMGFVLDPYDSCIANKMINGKQCTICWSVDDLKVSHVQRSVVVSIIAAFEGKYGKMIVTHGNKHKYVGMDIEFTNDGEAKILMTDYTSQVSH
jgi:hypothetical protein